MKRVYYFILPMILSFLQLTVFSQDSTERIDKLTINGYIKSLQTLAFDKNFKELVTGNLLHNRLNLKWKPSKTITASAEIRNRLFWGEEIKELPREFLRNDNELVNLSKTWIDNKGLLFHTNPERLWLEYRKQKWNARMGRQRINWGIATTWNPNDIFNSYNFLEFDYEERPGSDALKIQYLVNDFSNIELAGNLSIDKEKNVIGAKYFLNKWGYDVQFVAGLYHSKATLGAGWAGNIGEAGFKGEGEFFFNGKDSGIVFNGTLEAGYVFNNGWYLTGGFLYTSTGLKTKADNRESIQFLPSPEKLMPVRWSILMTTMKEYTPLLSGRLSFVYSPGVNLLIILPSFSYSLTENFSADVVAQSFFLELSHRFQAINHYCYLRVKWNF